MGTAVVPAPAAAMPGKAQGMTVEIPGEAAAAAAEQQQHRHRKGDVNIKEYDRNARVAEALQKCMDTPSSILTKQVSLTAADVEEYYMCARGTRDAHAASQPCFLGWRRAAFPSVRARAL